MKENDVEFEIPAGSFLALAVNAGHKVLTHTILPGPHTGWAKPGKDYMWMQDLDGTIYLEQVEKPND